MNIPGWFLMITGLLFMGIGGISWGLIPKVISVASVVVGVLQFLVGVITDMEEPIKINDAKRGKRERNEN